MGISVSGKIIDPNGGYMTCGLCNRAVRMRSLWIYQPAQVSVQHWRSIWDTSGRQPLSPSSWLAFCWCNPVQADGAPWWCWVQQPELCQINYICLVGKIISTLSDVSCLVTCNLQPAFCTNWLVLLPVCFCRSQHGETDRYFFWALQLTALHPTSTIFLEEPKPQLPVTAVVDSPFAATRHSAGVVKNYGYALAPKIVAPHLKELLDDPMVGSLMGWFMSSASPH